MKKQPVVISSCLGIFTDSWQPELAASFLLQKECQYSIAAGESFVLIRVCHCGRRHHPRHPSKDQYPPGRRRSLIESWGPGQPHARCAVSPCGHSDLCGCLFAGDCPKFIGPRGTTPGLVCRVGPRPPRAEWRMGALYPRHGASDLRLQSDRTDRTLDVMEAESVIVKDGERLLAFRSERSAIFTISGNSSRRPWSSRRISAQSSDRGNASPTASVPNLVTLAGLDRRMRILATSPAAAAQVPRP
jgi:hypothetical protein